MPSRAYWVKRGEKKAYSLTAWHVNQEYYFDGFMAGIVEGKQRIGKTSYCCKVLAQAHGEWSTRPIVHCESMNYEAVKNCLLFLPKEYLTSVLKIEEKIRGLILDDAGFWLFALDWYDPFVKSVNRFMQVGGTKIGTILMTSPSKRLISGKVLDALPELKIIRVSRCGRDRLRYRPRIARVYERWDWADGKRGGVHTQWDDNFNAILPDDFFNWYQPKRRGYVSIGEQLMATEVWKLEKRIKMTPAEKEDAMTLVDKVVGDESTLGEVNEVLKNLEEEQKQLMVKA